MFFFVTHIRNIIFQLFTLREQQTKSRHSSGSTEDGRHSVKNDTTSPPPSSEHIVEKDHHPKVSVQVQETAMRRVLHVNHDINTNFFLS